MALDFFAAKFSRQQDTWIDVCSLTGWPIWGISYSEGNIWNNGQIGHRCPWSRLSLADLPGTPVFQRVTSKSKAWNPQLRGAWGVGRLSRWEVGHRSELAYQEGTRAQGEGKALIRIGEQICSQVNCMEGLMLSLDGTGKGDRRNNLQWVLVMHQGLLYRLDLISEAASLIPFAHE